MCFLFKIWRKVLLPDASMLTLKSPTKNSLYSVSSACSMVAENFSQYSAQDWGGLYMTPTKNLSLEVRISHQKISLSERHRSFLITYLRCLEIYKANPPPNLFLSFLSGGGNHSKAKIHHKYYHRYLCYVNNFLACKGPDPLIHSFLDHQMLWIPLRTE